LEGGKRGYTYGSAWTVVQGLDSSLWEEGDQRVQIGVEGTSLASKSVLHRNSKGLNL
jgi:hypothetical protein